MLLSRLEINGFKSFAKKTEIHFTSGITAIVGPNGSGKSNIADAVRWVLGEQSARLLRGLKMEDVIFSGSESRKPQGYCEVALTFDNSDGSLPLDFAEVTIARRVYRSGESEYTINKNICRLKDISELFRDTGVGKEGYSIIGQGRVDELLSGKTGERRLVFEESAGVTRYRIRKEEAERKLGHTRDNMTRVEDIIAELERQLEPLEKQSEQAREYLKLREELKSLELNVFLIQYEKVSKRIADAKLSVEQLEMEGTDEEQKQTELTTRLNAINAQMEALNARISTLQNEIMKLSAGAEASLGESKVLLERRENLLRERERLTKENEQDAARLAELEGNILSGGDESTVKREALAILQGKIDEAEKEVALMDEQIEAYSAALDAKKAEMMEAMNRISDARSRESHLTAMRDSITQRMAENEKERTASTEEGSSLEEEMQGANNEFNALMEKKQAIAAEKQALEDRLERARARVNTLSNEMTSLEGKLQASRSRQNVLGEMKREYEGYYGSVRKLLRDAENNQTLKKCVIGVVAALVRVPEKLEAAIEMAAGAALQNIVTPTEEDAKQAIEYLRRNNYGRATFLPLSAVRANTLNNEERRVIQTEGCLGVASELIEYDEKYTRVIENILGRTVIVENIDVGIRLMKARNTFRIATLKGDIINPGGSMSGGSMQKKEFSLLGRERELAELSAAVESMQRELAQKRAQQEQLQGEFGAFKGKRKELDIKSHDIEIEITRQQEKLDIIKKYVEKNTADSDELINEFERLREQSEDIQNQLDAIKNVRDSLEQGNTASEQDILKEQGELTALRTARDEKLGAITAQKVEFMALKKEHDAFEHSIERIKTERGRIERAIAEREKAIQNGDVGMSALLESINKLESRSGDERKETEARQQELKEHEDERASLAAQTKHLQSQKDEMLDTGRELTERRHKLELTVGKAEAELEAMQNRIWDDYSLTFEGAMEFKKQIPLTASNVRIDELRKGIRELGDVNMSAIEDFKMVKERHESLREQQGDLLRAESDLQLLISELIGTMEHQFKQQFELINANFNTVFKQLFGGGTAELKLSDPDDVLNCEIEIVAQPPGKTLQLLSLLSGGERAMTAIALLFAMLKLKPTPFCILDEIESSLDEANVINFANYLKQYSDNTQFILITHRKDSMAAAESLFGVAMEERGVSKLVSVRLSDAETA